MSRFQICIGYVIQVCSHYVHLTEGAFESYILGKRSCNLIIFQCIEEGIELVVVAGIVLCSNACQVFGIIVASILRAVCPEDEIVGVGCDKTEIERSLAACYRHDNLFTVFIVVSVYLQNTTVYIAARTVIGN